MNKAKKYIIFTVSLLLVAVTAVGISLKVMADSIPVYLKEVVTSNDVEGKGGKQWLIDNGYTVIDNPIACVQSSYAKTEVSGNNCYTYFGYKTTTDKSEAITDIKLLHANSGYETKIYRDMVAKWKPNMEELGAELQNACLDVKAKFDAGSPLAQSSKDLLNLYDCNGRPLGDYLFASDRTSQDYQDIILICNSEVVNVIYSALSFGVADIGDDNFASRFSNQKAYSKMTVQEKDQADIDFWDSAVELLTVARHFATGYENGLLFLEDDDGNVDYSDIPESEDDIREYVAELEEEGGAEDPAFDTIYVALYNNLNKYPAPAGLDIPLAKRGADYSGNTDKDYRGLGDYLVGVSFSDDSDDAIRYLYPLVSALSEGQQAIARIQGFVNLSSTLNANTEANRTAISEKIEKARDEIKALASDENVKKDIINGRLSVYVGVDKDIYDQQIAMTDSAIRDAAAGGRYDQLGRDSQLTANALSVIKYTAIIGLACLGTALITMGLTAFFAGLGSIGALITYAVIGGSWMVGATAVGTLVVGIVGTALLVVAAIAVAIVIICAIIYWITKSIKDKEDHPDNVPIPNILYDVRSGKFVRYDYAKNSEGAPAVVNGTSSYVVSSSETDPGYYVSSVYAGWDALYVSTSKDAGSPILANNGKLFIQQMGNAVCPDNYMPLTRFGESASANLNGNGVGSGSQANYLYFATEKSLAGDEGGSAEQNKLYLSELDVETDGDRERALLALKKKGFTPVEYDLTYTNGTYSFLGYKTTTLENEAIRDIRVAYGFKKAEKFGSAGYANAGTTSNEATIYYSKYECTGSPIYADLCVFTDYDSAPKGWEPVNLFCGGNAFDFCIRQEWDSSWNHHTYLYFHPAEMYTSGTEYISGFAFFYGQKLDGYSLQDYMKTCGFKLTSNGTTPVCDGTEIIGDTEYISYSTTYNPKRAITDIVVYSPSQTASAASEQMSIAGYTYSACETFMQYEEQKWTRNWRSMRKSNCYATAINAEGLVTVTEGYDEVETDEYYYPHMRGKALYVCGPCSDKSPIKVSDFAISTSSKTMNGYRPVHEAWDYYATEATNLTQEYQIPRHRFFRSIECIYPMKKNMEHHLYMFIKGTAPKQGKYVKSITVASSYEDDFSDDYAILTLLAQGNGKIIKTNLNRNSGNQWYNCNANGYVTTKDITGSSAYMLVQYTDTIAESIRDITFKRVDSGLVSKEKEDKTTLVDKIIKHNSVNYNRCGDIVSSPNGAYVIYTSKNGVLGNPITDVFVDTNGTLSSDFCTAIDTAGKGNSKDTFFIHFNKNKSTGETCYYYNLRVGYGDSRDAALKMLYIYGCENFFDINVANQSEKYEYIGYCTTTDDTNDEIISNIHFLQNSSIGTTYTDVLTYDEFNEYYTNLPFYLESYSDDPNYDPNIIVPGGYANDYSVDGSSAWNTFSDVYEVVTEDIYYGSDTLYIATLKKYNKESVRGDIVNLQLVNAADYPIDGLANRTRQFSGAKDDRMQVGRIKINAADGKSYYFIYDQMDDRGVILKRNSSLLSTVFSSDHSLLTIFCAALALIVTSVVAFFVIRRRKKGKSDVERIASLLIMMFLTAAVMASFTSCGKKDVGASTTAPEQENYSEKNTSPWEDSLGGMNFEESTTSFSSFNDAYKFALQKELTQLLYSIDGKKGEITSAAVYDNDGDGTPCVVIFCNEPDGTSSINYFNFVNNSLIKEKIDTESNDGSEIIFIKGSDEIALRNIQSDKSTQSVYSLDGIYFGLYKTDTYESADAEALMDADLISYTDAEATKFVAYSTVAQMKNPVEYLSSQLKIEFLTE